MFRKIKILCLGNRLHENTFKIWSQLIESFFELWVVKTNKQTKNLYRASSGCDTSSKITSKRPTSRDTSNEWASKKNNNKFSSSALYQRLLPALHYIITNKNVLNVGKSDTWRVLLFIFHSFRLNMKWVMLNLNDSIICTCDTLVSYF